MVKRKEQMKEQDKDRRNDGVNKQKERIESKHWGEAEKMKKNFLAMVWEIKPVIQIFFL